MDSREIVLTEIREQLSPKLRKRIDKVILKDTRVQDVFLDNVLDFKSVLDHGKFKIDSYVNAVLYVSYFLLGETKMNSYSRVFKGKLSQCKKEGKSPVAISNMVNAYHRSKLVQLCLEQTIMPAHVMFRGTFFKAIKVQVDLMEDESVSDTVRQKAACSLMGHLKEPEVLKVEGEIEVKDERRDLMKELRETMDSLVSKQRKAIRKGDTDAEEMAKSDIIEAEFKEKDSG